MDVAITGANSAVGQAILRCGPQQAGSATFIAMVRSSHAADQLRRQVYGDGAARVVQASYDDPGSLDAVFKGASAVIHLAGILVEKPGSSYEQANVVSTRSVVEAAERGSVQKLVLISATAADENSSNRYYRTKGQAEALVRASGLPYTVLRAPLLLGPSTAGAASLKRNLHSGKAKLIGGGRNFQQPLYVDDLARAAIAACEPAVAKNLILDVVGPVSLPERELVERAASLLGRKVQIRSVSKGLLSLLLAARSCFAKPGFSRDALEVITSDTRLDPQLAARHLGIELTGIDQMIRNSVGEIA
jgi:NADH dehydrogenase